MSDRPATPLFDIPNGWSDPSCRFEAIDTACEWSERYRPGGLHPVQLGDVLGQRYCVLRKLGNGSYSTVWLAVDQRSVPVLS